MSIYGGTPNVSTLAASTTASGAAGLAFTGDHVAFELVTAAGFIFLCVSLVKAALRRPHQL
jgi:hypothetical protein